MKTLKLRLLLPGIIAIALSPASIAEQLNYYVDPDRGEDRHDGLSELSAVQTIERARDIVRELNRRESGDIVINLRGGVYQISSPITFDAADAGTAGRRIIYRNHQGEVPILTGGRTVSGEMDARSGCSFESKDRAGLGVPPALRRRSKGYPGSDPERGGIFSI